MKIIISTPLLAISLLIIGTASAQSNTYSPENCGNGIIDAGEQCDSGELNSNNLNVASFCNKECKFYKFLDKKLYFKCQINDNIPAKRNLYCRGKFYQYAQSCEIEAGETECVSEYPLLPLNSDER
ncbi:hypothetical protein KJ996_01345, partial [Patescibacteria group bacterium]|nr:hypothetical protein [Patescibacteria group bacterium]